MERTVATALPKDDLMDLDNIDLGFIRPRTPDDWTMAYAQSGEAYVNYLKHEFGADSVAQVTQGLQRRSGYGGRRDSGLQREQAGLRERLPGVSG